MIGGKTGTSQKYNEDGTISDQDVASFIAFGPYDDPQITVYFIVDEPQGSVYGSIVAAPFVGDFLSKAFEYMGIEPTEPIEGNVWTPNVVNMELSDAVLALEARGFQVQIEGAGTMVAAQSISSGTVVARDTTIRLTLKQEEPDSSLVKSSRRYRTFRNRCQHVILQFRAFHGSPRRWQRGYGSGYFAWHLCK